MRQRLEVLAAILSVGGAAFALQQATSTHGDLLPAGLYLSIAGAVVLVIASLQPGRSAVTWPARILTILGLVVALGLGFLAVVICGPTVLLFNCKA
jgi:hypothetical protein